MNSLEECFFFLFCWIYVEGVLNVQSKPTNVIQGVYKTLILDTNQHSSLHGSIY